MEKNQCTKWRCSAPALSQIPVQPQLAAGCIPCTKTSSQPGLRASPRFSGEMAVRHYFNSSTKTSSQPGLLGSPRFSGDTAVATLSIPATTPLLNRAGSYENVCLLLTRRGRCSETLGGLTALAGPHSTATRLAAECGSRPELSSQIRTSNRVRGTRRLLSPRLPFA